MQMIRNMLLVKYMKCCKVTFLMIIICAFKTMGSSKLNKYHIIKYVAIDFLRKAYL
jgi:hypothetical protein